MQPEPTREIDGTCLMIVTRVGEASYVPPGWTTADCSECGRAAWIDPDTVELAGVFGLAVVPICTRCLRGI